MWLFEIHLLTEIFVTTKQLKFDRRDLTGMKSTCPAGSFTWPWLKMACISCVFSQIITRSLLWFVHVWGIRDVHYFTMSQCHICIPGVPCLCLQCLITHETLLPDIEWDVPRLSSGTTQIIRFMGPTWGPPGADRTQVDPMLAP